MPSSNQVNTLYKEIARLLEAARKKHPDGYECVGVFGEVDLSIIVTDTVSQVVVVAYQPAIPDRNRKEIVRTAAETIAEFESQQRAKLSAEREKLTPHQQREAIERRDRGAESAAEIGRSYDVSGWTIAKL